MLWRNCAIESKDLPKERKIEITMANDELAAILKDKSKVPGKDYQVVDVRIDEDFATGHIRGATNITIDKIANSVEELQKAPTVIFHCARSEVRGPKAALEFEKQIGGSENTKQNVLVLRGGFTEWRKKYANDESLTEDYNEEFWKNESEH
ncbi:hypothetical protein HK096_009077 [Nowakowskiella sp. JEL0078]|nr:hypothetical protein HK096_009077 [Nowakowskiella sp. JEL0078]